LQRKFKERMVLTQTCNTTKILNSRWVSHDSTEDGILQGLTLARYCPNTEIYIHTTLRYVSTPRQLERIRGNADGGAT
jgi:hypothetical protein